MVLFSQMCLLPLAIASMMLMGLFVKMSNWSQLFRGAVREQTGMNTSAAWRES